MKASITATGGYARFQIKNHTNVKDVFDPRKDMDKEAGVVQ